MLIDVKVRILLVSYPDPIIFVSYPDPFMFTVFGCL
jgi:hypothetical protein